ncbi:hypothetical protein BT93_E1170 [Corymbia citriodora subsp. variegata]|nr:hypothetical protein BT93_E1170 [Corymbia citriodora subsp. variegata]
MNAGSFETWNRKTEKKELRKRIKSHLSLKQNPRRCNQNVSSNEIPDGISRRIYFPPIQDIKVKAMTFTCIL